MKSPLKARRARRVAALAMVTLVAASGCDDDSGRGDASADNPSSAPASEEAQVKQTFAALRRAEAQGDGHRFCDLLTQSAQEHVATNAFPGQGFSCPKAIAISHKLNELSKIKNRPAKTVAVSIDGRAATAMISDGGRKPVPVKVVKVDGRWKLPDPGFHFWDNDAD
jgi:hypothetical protein